MITLTVMLVLMTIAFKAHSDVGKLFSGQVNS